MLIVVRTHQDVRLTHQDVKPSRHVRRARPHRRRVTAPTTATRLSKPEGAHRTVAQPARFRRAVRLSASRSRDSGRQSSRSAAAKLSRRNRRGNRRSRSPSTLRSRIRHCRRALRGGHKNSPSSTAVARSPKTQRVMRAPGASRLDCACRSPGPIPPPASVKYATLSRRLMGRGFARRGHGN